MQNTKFILGLGMLLILTTGLSGQDDQTSDQTPEQTKAKNLDQTIEIYSMIMTKTFEKAQLEESQLEKIKEIVDRCIPEMVRTRDVLDNILTPEQKKKYAAAMKLAQKAKYAQEEAEGYSLRKLKLSEETLTNYKNTKKKVDDINANMNIEIAGILTEEQKKRLPKMFQPPQPKMKEHAFKFPMMKTEEDSDAVWKQISSAVEGATDFVPNLKNQTANLKVPAATDIKKELEKLAAEPGSELLADWKKIPRVITKPRGINIKKPSGAGKSPATGGNAKGK